MKNEKPKISGKKDYKQLYEQFYSWFISSQADELRLAEYTLLSGIFQNLYGEFVCCVGVSEQQPDLFCHNKKYCFSLGTIAKQQVSMISDVHFWPIESKSMDIVLLHHALEWTRQPQRVLREVSRVLCPGGILVILNFNPWSLGAACRFISNYYPKEFRFAKLYSTRCIKKWLNVLGFSCKTLQFALRWAPLHYTKHMNYSNNAIATLSLKTAFRQFPTGNIFLLVAVKENAGFISSDQILHKNRSVVHPSYAGANF